jgi:creatinine amidohydrolase
MKMLDAHRRSFAHLTWVQVRDMPAKDRAVLIQPVASTEQHGPHLPLLVDAAIGEAVLAEALTRLADTVPVFALPPLRYGKSDEHLDFPGTISLTAGTLLAVLVEIAGSLHRAGFRRLVLLSSHGGNRQIVEVAARDIHLRYPAMWVFPLLLGEAPLAPARPAGRGLDLHAGEYETSLMMVIAPDAVRTDAAVTEYPPDALVEGSAGARIPFGWSARDLTASGVIGDARAASPEKGRRLLDAAADGLAREIEMIHALGL